MGRWRFGRSFPPRPFGAWFPTPPSLPLVNCTSVSFDNGLHLGGRKRGGGELPLCPRGSYASICPTFSIVLQSGRLLLVICIPSYYPSTTVQFLGAFPGAAIMTPPLSFPTWLHSVPAFRLELWCFASCSYIAHLSTLMLGIDVSGAKDRAGILPAIPPFFSGCGFNK